MTSGTVPALLVALLSCSLVFGQTQQVQFNQVLNINGDMALNSFQFPDRSKVETFSQKQQQLIVNQQTPAIPPNQVTGTTGQPFVGISSQSMTISTNGATDLVGAQIQMSMTPESLQAVAVQPDNTYVAMLSPDRQTWMIQESIRTVNGTDMTVRMVKRNQLDGEYMIVGRQTVETNTLVVPFGSDSATSVAIQGTGLQENEFEDGFRMSTRASQPMTMNVDVKDGIDSSMLAALQGQEIVNDYRYSVVTNLAAVTPDLNQQVTVIQMPINAVRIQKMMQTMGVPPTGQVAIAVAQRGVLQNPGGATGNLGGAAAGARARRGETRDEFRKKVARQVQAGQSGQTGQNGQTGQQTGTATTGNNPVAVSLLLAPTFTPIQADAQLDQANMRIAVPVPQVDGEYILVMQMMNGAAAQLQPTQDQTPPAEAPQAPEGEQTANNGTETAQPERRQESTATDKYGLPKPPQGAVIMTMKEIDTMADAVKWGGQLGITQMMQNYVKAQTGNDLSPAKASAGAETKIVV
ncbi:hypothetical protein IAQ61_010296 [Plenodomus lingam]|uniref:Uncharacterized protein n=1 Tax=Leptosphaeria maculans (strain JN3 / isolate v23.1.3 / race Av1-4-5-6-7-8) TaxID=985895 RepID=E5A3I4_LEPMJ|nr:hypothetical protein LEMA_P096060.1 [Plenodomus lingam JN3]KAH9862094.1 hypothetical protein IAQ61_010296 [Plenodomus lingam]CBX98197.1 hypothetical protein LEMA_P096060.1 [Plenodomus lingam JN3]